MATTTKKTTKTNNSDDKRVKELEAQVAQLSEMVQLLTKAGLANNQVVNNSIDRDVTVISLCNNILNLSTEPYGGGIIYTFNEFGEEQTIPYSDVRLIIRSNKKFIKEGKCYIVDDDIVANEHLTRDYERLLNKEELLDLLGKDRNTFSKIFDTMTQSQKEIFRNIISEKLSKDKSSVDMNIVQKVNDTLKTDILKDIELGKGLFEEN